MKGRIKHIWYTLVLVVLALFSCTTTNKVAADDCTLIAEMFAFGDSIDFKLDTSEINKEKLKKFRQEVEMFPSDQSRTAFFVAPLFVNKIRFFHSRCNKLNDKEEYVLLVDAYNLIANQKFSTSYNRKDIVIDSITDNFKSLCRIDSVFASAVGLFMAGPYYGTQVELTGRFYPNDTLLITGGMLVSYHNELSKNVCIGFTKSGEKTHQWLMKLDEAYSGATKFGSLKESVLGYEIGINNEGDGGLIFLRPNGDFRFYLLNMF